VLHLMTAEPFRKAVEVSERYADGLASSWRLEFARLGLPFVTHHPAHRAASFAAHSTGWLSRVTLGGPTPTLGHTGTMAYYAAWQAAAAVAGAAGQSAWGPAWTAERAAQAALLRDIFGNPFGPAPAVDPSWLAWNGGTVAKLAAAIYDGRCFADLPILADALEDAGCADAAILAHCRGGGGHVRGCWVVDLLTGRL
jgi:hypothetical protein